MDDDGSKLARVKWQSSATAEIRIDFRDITLTMQGKKKRGEKQAPVKTILRGLSGTVRPSRLALILGPSGSGKTSLLTVLASRTKYSKGMELTGNITVNGRGVDWKVYRRSVAYVEQDDLLFPNLTVRETLMIAVELRMPQNMTREEKDNFVQDLSADLGVSSVLDSRIGDHLHKSISGGERKRVAIAIEILHSPPVIFCDEPTSGLDANASLSVMQLMHRLSSSGRAVVASIHQPRSSIFALADDLFILAKGEIAYFGPADQFLGFLESIGHGCPSHFNPADFAIDLVSMDYRSAELEKKTSEKISQLTKGFSSSMIRQQSIRESDAFLLENSAKGGSNAMFQASTTNKRYGASFCKQYSILLTRAAKNKFRSRQTLIGPLIVAVIFGLVLGGLYYDIGYSQKAIQDRLGILFFISLNQSFNALISVLATFGSERAIVLRERAAKMYRVSAYFLTRILVDVPFSIFSPWLLCVIAYWMAGLNPDPSRFIIFILLITLAHFTSVSLGLVLAASLSPQTANGVGAPILLILMLFSGFYANIQLISPVISWIQYISPVRWVFSAAVINEFSNETFLCPPGTAGCRTNGDDVIDSLSFQDDSVVRSVVILCAFIIFFEFFAYVALRRNKPHYINPSPIPSSFSRKLPEDANASIRMNVMNV